MRGDGMRRTPEFTAHRRTNRQDQGKSSASVWISLAPCFTVQKREKKSLFETPSSLPRTVVVRTTISNRGIGSSQVDPDVLRVYSQFLFSVAKTAPERGMRHDTLGVFRQRSVSTSRIREVLSPLRPILSDKNWPTFTSVCELDIIFH